MENQNDEKLAQKYKDHLAKQRVYHKTYRDKNKEKLKIKNKVYHLENQEQILEAKADYYQKNKDEINAKRKEKIICECGSKIARDTKSRHKKTKKHILAIKAIENALAAKTVKAMKAIDDAIEANQKSWFSDSSESDDNSESESDVNSDGLVKLSLNYPNKFN